MRFLIYLVSFGEHFHHYTRMAVTTILEIGGWRHDIIVLTDTDASFPGPATRAINILPDLHDRYPWLDPSEPGVRIAHVKAEIARYVDLRAYDYVLYLDSDVLVNSDRLPDVVANACRERIVVVQQDNQPVSLGYDTAGGLVLTKAERKMWGPYRINSGIVGLPPTPIARRLLRDWQRMNVSYRFKSRDQGNLISLLLRTYYGQWGYIGDSTFGREVRRYPETFIHITRNKPMLIQPYYEQVLGLRLPT